MENPMDNNINNYRNPMVTAIGIILGFVLAYMGKWATEPTIQKGDLGVAIGFLIGISLLIVALYRILNNRVEKEREEAYYHRTLKIFMLGIICSFIGTLLTIFQEMFF